MKKKEQHLKDRPVRWWGVVILFALIALVFAGCPNGSTDDTPQKTLDTASLVNAVYGGLNPMDAWVTVAFKPDSKAVCAFSGDNTCNEWDYTYYTDKTGEITASGWSPGAFTLNDDRSV